ncbi:MAG: xanthine dehydrogenase small subunit [Comamonas sp.]
MTSDPTLDPIPGHPTPALAQPQAQASAIPPAPPTPRPLRFVRRGEIVTLHGVPPSRTLLEVLREDLDCSGTKEGCGEGDCGACTVVLAEAAPGGGHAPTLQYRAINSCIRLAHSIDGMALWTVEDIAAGQPGFAPVAPPEPAPGIAPPDAATGATTCAAACADLHPAQQALVQHHASQCGFCTPGFVMSLFGLYQSRRDPARGTPVPISRHDAQVALSGNLCRCTGYRPILDAAQALHRYAPQWVDEAEVSALLARIRPHDDTPPASYQRPTRLAALLRARADAPQAQVVAGSTDVGLWITKQHRQFAHILDVTAARELTTIERTTAPTGGPESKPGAELTLGAAVRLTDAFEALAGVWPELRIFSQRFAGLPVRNAGTLGGNVANGSPIGDSMPLLIALQARVVLASVRGSRELPLESLYTGYRRNVMAADEILAFVKVPLPATGERALLRAYKISKRYDDDISAVCLVLNVQVSAGQVASVSIGAGGVAATPVRARQTEAALAGQPWTEATVRAAMAVLRQEFQPISDMRASGDYRRAVLANLLWRFWLETQGPADAALNLDDHRLSDERMWA